ncbi:U4/U6.U5 tri-snrnp-associated protein 2 [Phtheirospermum japonicum]|uniref:U4/U6.U5 tri-snrnp-associated protein 2 n=1 Tax=Phtheirospermum japonicum TaxID=374723 RepID=A0A830CY73_9LAMI|nr:U4/U6.U5 tri-snrnp-associated protein 2 [Phtheirospermum japonicum]
MKKFDGETVTEVVHRHLARMRYRVTRLPQYLILHKRRFTMNNFFVEKNPTLVNFLVKNLELKDYIPSPVHNENEKMRSKYDLIANIVHDVGTPSGMSATKVANQGPFEQQTLTSGPTCPPGKDQGPGQLPGWDDAAQLLLSSGQLLGWDDATKLLLSSGQLLSSDDAALIYSAFKKTRSNQA